jgi:hypothetical protein
MTHPTISRPAAELVRGDRIAAGFLPQRRTGEVRFAETYATDCDWTLVVYRYPDDVIEADHFRADADIPLDAVADTGHGYSREADDPTPVSPARVPLHTGAVVDGDELIVDGQTS